MEKTDKSSHTESIPMGQIKKPFFSIIVPVYNVEKYLEKCVHSLLRQENAADILEIILVDDGSTDQSGALCDRMAKEFLQVRTFHQENGGLSSARNLGIQNSNGEYIIFADSDDHVDKNMCSRVYDTIRKYGNVDAVCFDGTEYNGSERTSMRRVPLKEERCAENGKEYLKEHYRDRNLNVEVYLWAYRKGFLMGQNLRFIEGRLHEDVEFTSRMLLLCGRIVELPDSLYHYIVRENSISTQKNKEKNIQDLFLTLKEQCEMAEHQPSELKMWMKDAALNRYLNMVYYARMYEPRYRKLLDKRFLFGKAATNWNRFRALICFINVRLYCWINDCYKKVKS